MPMPATSSSPGSAAPKPAATGPVRVLIVDDSAVVREMLSRELAKDPMIKVVGTAADPYIARDKIVELEPDVLTLDVEMPRMDGITFLRHLMASRPMPVIVLSSLTAQGTKTAIDALSAGAVDVLAKPGSSFSVDAVGTLLASRIRAAAKATVQKTPTNARPKSSEPRRLITTDKIIAIGASTGGVQALTEVLTALPSTAPGVLVVQHMPEKFTASFAQRLDSLCELEVKEAADGDRLFPGRVLIAPGGKHMLLKRSGAEYLVRVKDGPEVFHQRPSVEVMFNSVAEVAGENAVGALLTGMGADGALGLLAMRKAGARTICQNESTCVVFGMPAEGIKCGGAERVLPLDRIARNLMAGAAGAPMEESKP